MKYDRFGRLDSKYIELLKEFFYSKIEQLQLPYEMALFFPYLTTRLKSMDQRHTITSFKTMSKTYRYCYALDKHCIAKIKNVAGIRTKEAIECEYIDNNRYVFTNIPPYDFDEDGLWDLVYDNEEIFIIKNENNAFDYITINVLNNMKKRRISSKQFKALENFLTKVDTISLKSKNLTNNSNLSDATFSEFVWRYALYNSKVYSKAKKTEEYKYNLSTVKKRTRVEDAYSIFKYYDRHSSLQYARNFFNKLNSSNSFNHVKSSNKYIYDYLVDKFGDDIYDKNRVNEFFQIIQTIYNNKIEYLYGIQRNYLFLNNPYSKTYRKFFSQRRNIYSLFKTQQIMRKLKTEYYSIDNEVEILKKEIELIKYTIYNYKQYIGENLIPNEGLGYVGDGWYDNEDDESLVHEIRNETDWELEQERRIRQEQENEKYQIRDEMIRDIEERYKDIDKRVQEIEKLHEKWEIEDNQIEPAINISKHILEDIDHEECELQIQQDEENEFYERRQQEIDWYLEQNDKKGLFEYVGVNNEFFWHFKSISIKDVVEIKKWNIKDGVSIDGEFFSDKEIIDWENENVIKISQDENQDDWLKNNNSNVNNENESKSEYKSTFISKQSNTPSNLDLDDEDDIPF